MVKILLIEDNELNLDMLSRRLERQSFDVIMAVDGKQGVDLAQSEAPDIILMDMSLPIMDGWEATQRLKMAQDTAHIPIIALTAHAIAGDRERCLAAGCDEYESKPVKFPRLLDKINALIGGS